MGIYANFQNKIITTLQNAPALTYVKLVTPVLKQIVQGECPCIMVTIDGYEENWKQFPNKKQTKITATAHLFLVAYDIEKAYYTGEEVSEAKFTEDVMNALDADPSFASDSLWSNIYVPVGGISRVPEAYPDIEVQIKIEAEKQFTIGGR